MAKKKSKKKAFDWSRQRFRHFLIKFAYDGSRYHGVAFQPPTRHPNRRPGESDTIQVPTVEKELIRSLETARLIPSRSECRFSRCGRTDKGVHAGGNYLSLDLRVSDDAIDPALKSRKDQDVDMVKNMNYCQIMNALLPDDIRVIEVRQVPDNFDARFSCLFRRYEYYFPCIGVDVELMNKAAKLYLGTHDFSNFCKMDVANTRDFSRTLLRFDVTPLPDGIFAVARCDGLSFLWHQVRCMMAILLLIGRGYEEMELISTLLDTKNVPRKPQYDLAPEEGLILKECFFDLEPTFEKNNVQCQTYGYQGMVMRAIMNKHIIDSLNGHGFFDNDEEAHLSSLVISGPPRARYVNIMNRPTEKSFSEKKAAFEAAEQRKSKALDL